MRRAQQEATPRRRTVPAVLGLGIAALLTVAACGSGQLAQTAGMPPAVNGGTGQAGKIAVRNAVVAYPESGRTYAAGSDVPLVATIVNSGSVKDSLVSVTSTISAPAEITGSRDLLPGTALVAGQGDLDRPSQSATADATQPPASSSSATPTTTGSGSASATTTTAPANTSIAPSPPPLGQITIVFKGVNTTVQPGQSITVTFTFAQSGPVTLTVPVAAPGASPAE